MWTCFKVCSVELLTKGTAKKWKRYQKEHGLYVEEPAEKKMEAARPKAKAPSLPKKKDIKGKEKAKSPKQLKANATATDLQQRVDGSMKTAKDKTKDIGKSLKDAQMNVVPIGV